MSEAISIFNIGQHQEEVNAGMFRQRGESNLFDPKLKDASDTITFIIRAMPYFKDPVHSMVGKNFYALPDPAGTIFFDSRTTFNRPQDQHYEFCEVSDLWLKLQNAKDPNIKKLAEQLRMQRANYCYVQIIAYPRDPKLNGTMAPMRIPVELSKALESLAKPSKDDLALGAVPCQPFDIMKSKNFKCTISGKMIDGVLMRDWKVEPMGEPGEASFPLGPNGEMTPVSKLKQEDVLKYFEECQTVDLEQQYGYHAPNVDAKIRMKAYLQRLVGGIPGLREVAANYFPELAQQAGTSVEANAQQPAPEPLPENAPAGPAIQTAGDPMAPQAPAPEVPANAGEGPVIP